MESLSEIQDELYEELPDYAAGLITGRHYRQPADPYRERFAANPDDPLMHSPKWHQWGIVSHTRQVGRQFRQQLPRKLREWFGDEAANTRLGLKDERVDGHSKWDLLLTSVPTHDWGKFTVRRLRSGSRPDFRFGGHESESGALVRARRGWFAQRGIADGALEYLARCSELHFELGKVRDFAKVLGGYHLAWVQSDSFVEAVGNVTRMCPGFEREVGLFFLADNWGKTDLLGPMECESDVAIQDMWHPLENEIEARGLHPNLIQCAIQLPVNTAVGRRYLELLEIHI